VAPTNAIIIIIADDSLFLSFLSLECSHFPVDVSAVQRFPEAWPLSADRAGTARRAGD